MFYEVLMEKQSDVEYRGHTFPGYNKPMRNTGGGKHKKMVLAKSGDTVKLVRYGHRDYGHNISPKRKANYLKRSAGIRDKSGKLTKDNKLSANHWARKDLWPSNKPTMSEKRAHTMFYEVLMEKRANKDRARANAEMMGYTQPGDLRYDRDKLLRGRNTAMGSQLGILAGGAAGVGLGVTGKLGKGLKSGLAAAAMPVLGGVLGAGIGRYGVGARGDRDALDLHVRKQITDNALALDDLRNNYGLTYDR